MSPVTVTSGVSTDLGPPLVTVEGRSDKRQEKTLGMLGNPHERVSLCRTRTLSGNLLRMVVRIKGSKSPESPGKLPPAFSLNY